MRKLELLSPCLPSNTLDELIDGLGGTQSVAEMTGRRGRVVSLPGGGVQYQLRSEQEVNMELLNIREKQRFMDGEKVPIKSHLYSIFYHPPSSSSSLLFLLTSSFSSSLLLSPPPVENCHHLRSSKLWYFIASGSTSEESETKSSHHIGTSLEC